METEVVSYKPSAWYFRAAIRNAKTLTEAREAGMVAVLELEELKAWIRELGLVPPKRFVLRAEACEKRWISGQP